MKILIRLPNWLGDVVMSTAFVTSVKEIYPHALVDVIIKKDFYNIAKLISGLNTIHSFSKQEYKGLYGVYRFGKKLRSEQYDLFFNLPTSLSSVVMGWATAAKKRIGFKGEGGAALLTNAYTKPGNVHRADEYISLIERYTGKKITNRRVKLNIDEQGHLNKDTVLVNFNSEADSRRMPLVKSKAILNLLTNTFSNCTFTLIGAPKDRVFVDKVVDGATNIERIENLAGKTDLNDLIKLMTGFAVLLTTDSGPAHLANAIGVPVVVLFGAGDERNTAPYNKQNLSVIRYGRLPCEPCVKNTCKLYGTPKCMELLDELQIVNQLGQYLFSNSQLMS